MAEQFGPQQTMLATVKEVNEENGTCTLVEDDGFEFPLVRLKPVIDNTESVILFPKPGTWALAIRIEQDEEWLAISFGEIEKWRLVIGDRIIDLDATGLLVANGDDTLKEILLLIIQSVQNIMVLYGNNPDFIKLLQAETKTNNLFR